MSEKKQYKMVTVKTELTEGVINLPEFDRLPNKVMRRLTSNNDISALYDFIAENSDEESLEAFDEIAFGDMDQFLEDWTKSSELPAPKSEK